MNELALFAGAGGGILGGLLLGWRTVCAVEIDAYCRNVLLARQRDGMLLPFPIWDDVCTFDGKPWRGHIDVVSGGFPCQDISSAGKGAGIDGEKSGLWRQFARIVREVEPRYVLVENSPMLATRGLGVVLGDLATLGFDARWDVLGAWHVGAPHRRDRMWIVATHPDRCGERELAEHAEVAGAQAAGTAPADSDRQRSERRPTTGRGEHRPGRRPSVDGGHAADADGAALRQQPGGGGGARGPEAREPGATRWRSLDCIAGVDDGLPHRLDRVRATGNGQVPAVARLAWETLAPTEAT